MSAHSISTPVARACYRIANLLITLDRLIRTSRGRGVKMLVEGDGGGVLLVRHTYGDRHWTLPGGRVRRAERTDNAAQRELAEELSIEPERLEGLGSYPVQVHRRHEVVDVYLASASSDIEPNPVEIESARWFHSDALPREIDPRVGLALGLLAGRRAEAAATGR